MSALVHGSIVGQNDNVKLWMLRGVLGLIYFSILSNFLLKLLLVFATLERKTQKLVVIWGGMGQNGVKNNKIVIHYIVATFL